MAAQTEIDPFGPGVGASAPVTIEEKLDSIVIPSIEFADTPFPDAIDFLRSRAFELDVWSPEPNEKGINIVTKLSNAGQVRIHLKLHDIPLREALRYTAALANAKMQISETAVSIVPNDAPEPKTRAVFLLPQELAETLSEGSIKEKMEEVGITFPIGSSVAIQQNPPLLVTVNEPDQLELVESYLASLLGHPPIRQDGGVGVSAMQKKLNEIVIPRIEFNEVPLPDALGFIEEASMHHDRSGDLQKKGINIVLEFDPRGGEMPRITLTLSNISLGEGLRNILQLAGCEYEVETDAILIRRQVNDQAPF